MNMSAILKYLTELNENNNRKWYHAHKAEYKAANAENVPAGYDIEHPQAESLKRKSWYLEYPVRDVEFEDAERFLTHAAEIFHLMKPFNDYLNKALTGFQMPERKG